MDKSMGHDISAYLGRVNPTDLEMVASPEELTEEIAYLRGHYGLYEALDAQFYDGKVSGIGTSAAGSLGSNCGERCAICGKRSET